MSVVAADGHRPHCLDPPRERIYAPEASMAASVETVPIDRWAPAEDADVLPSVANGEDQQEPARMVPVAAAAVDPDVPCRDVAEQQHKEPDQAAGDVRVPEAERPRRIVAEVPNVVAMLPKDGGRRHRP